MSKIDTKKQQELSTKIVEYFSSKCETEPRKKASITVSFTNDTCTVHLKKMYQGLGSWISFENLNWLSNLLGTEKINIRNEHYRRGCDSCDWGSEHNADIICQEITII